MKLPGFLTPTGMKLAGAVLLLVIIISIAGGNRLFSPGALSEQSREGIVRGGITSHAELSSTCSACHTAPWGKLSMNDLCVDCHTEIQADLNNPGSLHGILKATSCRDCHTEHSSPQGYLTQIGTLQIDHELFGFSLAAHQNTADDRPFACTDCHTENLGRFDPSQCETCHRSFDERFTGIHAGEFGAECRACHDGVDIFSSDRFDHNRLSFPLLGKHAEVRCIDCHPSVTNLAGFQDAPGNCESCHLEDNPHPVNFGTDCAGCHNSEGWQTEIFDHNLSAFKLTGKHIQVECQQCHVNDVYRGTPTECVSCHLQDDVHRGDFGTECALCHSTETWIRGPFEHTFPLDHGGLGAIACVTCHTTPGSFEAYTCSNCHNPEDIRRQHAFAEMMNTDLTNCARCHPTGQETIRMH